MAFSAIEMYGTRYRDTDLRDSNCGRGAFKRRSKWTPEPQRDSFSGTVDSHSVRSLRHVAIGPGR